VTARNARAEAMGRDGHEVPAKSVVRLKVPEFGSTNYCRDGSCATPGACDGGSPAQSPADLSRVRARVVKVLASVRIPGPDAEDAAQQVLAELSRDPAFMASCRDDAHLGAAIWLAICRVRTARRIGQRRREQESAWASCSGLQVDPERLIVVRDIFSLFAESVMRLPETQRLVVIVCVIEGYSHAEAAERLGIRPGTVKSRLRAGMLKLRARIQPELRRGDEGQLW
jgi:RNA polymerase sigma factor (sigma-70 family)